MKKLNVSLLLIGVVIISITFSSCKPDMRASDAQYYYLLNYHYLMNNNRCTFVGDTATEYAIWEETNHKYVYQTDDYFPFDYYIDDKGNTYELGQHVVNQYDTVAHHYVTILYEPYIEVNGTKKTVPVKGEALRIVPNDKDLYFIISEEYETGEYDRFGAMMSGYKYYAISEGNETEFLGSQESSELGGKAAKIKSIKRIDDDFYIVGVRENAPMFCKFQDIATPYILSLNIGASNDLMKVDTTILVCGNENSNACIWLINGSNIEQIMLPVDDELSSNACVIEKVGKDIYIGGRIGNKPVIWKNNEIFAVYEEFPPHQEPYYLYSRPDVRFTYQSGCVQALRIVGKKAYSVVVTENTPNKAEYIDNKLMAVEWDFSKNPIACQYKYDLVEMLRSESIYLYDSFYHNDLYTQWVPGLIEPYETYWEDLEYTHPRIALKHAKR